MRAQEIDCFARALACQPEQIGIFDLLSGAPTVRQLDPVDMVCLGGSGDYSVAVGGAWLPPALEAMRELCDLNKPTFASCWGFQAMARALGGTVVTDLGRAELGTVPVTLTPAGREDPVFGHFGPEIRTHMGHQDIVDSLPDSAVLLGSTDLVTNQAFRIDGKPIYCTQFHPELTLTTYMQRVWNYPWYVERIVGVPLEKFAPTCTETPEANQLLRRFVTHVFDTTRPSPLAPSPLAPHHSPLTTRPSPLAPHHSPLTTRPSPLAPHHSPLTTRPSPLAPHHSPLTTRPSPLAPHHSPLTTRPSPLAPHHSPLTTRPSPLAPGEGRVVRGEW